MGGGGKADNGGGKKLEGGREKRGGSMIDGWWPIENRAPAVCAARLNFTTGSRKILRFILANDDRVTRFFLISTRWGGNSWKGIFRFLLLIRSF